MSEQLSLTTILARIIAASEIDAGSATAITLPRGLVVSVKSESAKFTLITWRVNQLPDAQEWQTCFDYLPAGYKPATRPEPVPYRIDQQAVLSASWPVLKLL